MTWVQARSDVEYLSFLIIYFLQDQLDDEALFPSKIGVPFPNNFLNIAKTILKRLFRVYAHIYHQHFKVVVYTAFRCNIFWYFQEIVSLGEEAHLNTSFKHFVYFIQEFELIDKKELAPLQELIDRLTSIQTE